MKLAFRPYARAFRVLLYSALIVGAVHCSFAAGYSLSFDGVNDYVSFGPAPGLGAATFTVETWFKRTGAGVSASTGVAGVDAIPLVTKGRAEVDGDNRDMNYFLGTRASDNVLVADFEEGATGASPGQNHPVAGVTPIANNVWYHAAATYDGTKWQLFLNGALEAELVVGQPPRSDSIQYAALGSAIDSTGAAAGFFNGVLDEVRIWNYARSAQQIADNKNLEIPTAPGLIGRWGLNEGSGTVAADSSGSGINGSLVNGPLWTTGFQPSTAPIITRGPYLQMGTPTSVAVRWRTDQPTTSRVSFGPSSVSLTSNIDDATSTIEHEVRLTGLTPARQYYYSIGSTTQTLASGSDFNFFTSPPVGTQQPTRIWVLGDSGEVNPNADAVRNAYTAFNGTRYTDLWLMLGDNAYETGSDSDYQAGLFNRYPAYLRQSVLWPTIGNHDTNQSSNPPPDLPYFRIFTLPTAGEAGGVPSATEKYYSFDFANIHFICLDAMSSDRSPNGPMLTWLQSDLASTRQGWIIAFWHHPPYTKGYFDSDTDPQLIEIRQNFLPILEAGGVDLVLCGHSHSYERSFLLNGHYGLSNTLTSSMLLNAGNGREDGTGAYRKPAGGPAANQGAVYVVAGSSAETLDGPFNHPAMFLGMARLGSLVLDVNANRLDAKFLRETGAIDDYFTIIKDIVVNTPLTLTSVVSMKTHGTAGAFGVNLPLPPVASPRGVECRTPGQLPGGAADDYQLVFTFGRPLQSVASATVVSHNPPAPASTGTVDGPVVVGPNASLGLSAKQCAVNLTNVSNAQYITVSLSNVVDAAGNSGNILSPQMGVLVGDVNADGGASNLDVSLVKAKVAAGATVDSSNFRDDVNADGGFSNLDVSVTKAQVAAGAALPSLP